MKNKILSFLVVFLIVTVSSSTNIFASFADFTDEQADKQSQEQLKEQENEHNITEVKSSDNYLTDLQIEGYTLTPEFNKQTLEYVIKEEIKSNEINIKATTSNDKAKVTGLGKIQIEENKNDYRIDVEAENGSVRTYIIKLKATNAYEKTEAENMLIEPNQTEKTEELVSTKLENGDSKKQETNENKGVDYKIFIIIGSIIAVILIVIIFARSRKGKRRRKH